jgi:hypothetical protein
MVLRYKKIILLSAVLIALFGLVAVSAQTLSLTIRPYNEEIYFPDSDIYLYITIRNDSSQTQRFRLADDRVHNIEFSMRNQRNEAVESTQNGSIPTRVNQVYYRTIGLEPGDHFSFVEPLTEYVRLERPGIYTVAATFFPELRSIPQQMTIRSNSISISVRPGETVERQTSERFEAVAERELQQERLPPDETVTRMIQARREGNWDRFFLYLNVERLFRQNDARERRFTAPNVGEAEQRAMLDDYRESLRASAGARPASMPADPTNMAEPIDTALTVVPSDFEIQRTTYTPNEGTVEAILRFDHDRYREVRLYTYQVERRRNGAWQVVGYNVSVQPNEGLDQ